VGCGGLGSSAFIAGDRAGLPGRQSDDVNRHRVDSPPVWKSEISSGGALVTTGPPGPEQHEAASRARTESASALDTVTQLSARHIRIDPPEKNWKLSAGDVAERAHRDEYQLALSEMLTHTSTGRAQRCGIPADHKVVRAWPWERQSPTRRRRSIRTTQPSPLMREARSRRERRRTSPRSTGSRRCSPRTIACSSHRRLLVQMSDCRLQPPLVSVRSPGPAGTSRADAIRFPPRGRGRSPAATATCPIL